MKPEGDTPKTGLWKQDLFKCVFKAETSPGRNTESVFTEGGGIRLKCDNAIEKPLEDMGKGRLHTSSENPIMV